MNTIDPTIVFAALALLTLIIGIFRNIPGGVAVLWFVAVGWWLFVSVPLGWVLLLACVIAACVVPSRRPKAKP